MIPKRNRMASSERSPIATWRRIGLRPSYTTPLNPGISMFFRAAALVS
jgi:hypothetical protein